eukprot:NODE_3431_length_978_cov_50.824543_g3153_i0.p1 GENE.NODE_3431_length_978_cov_50.824543_g3153_i0~~NODE_3431_length_978_cov_50.824543_g3153_i0.p1  ORF type:complete len:212 (-),score=41.72 NODE_3431_length_978_cov_50.824543_g3153_i0:219-854(-)
MQRFYTPSEVAQHNTEDDCWVSALGKVLDLTPLIQQHRGTLTNPIVKAAGTDISHWFGGSNDIKRCVDPKTGLEQHYTPQGRFVHVLPSVITSDLDNDFEIPWWQNEEYIIGLLTNHTRKVRIINTLNHHEATLEVCCEETLSQIQDRYLAFNVHAPSYTWKRMNQNLEMDKTLAENGIEDESEEFSTLGLPDDYYIPAIHLYFNDDLTVG